MQLEQHQQMHMEQEMAAVCESQGQQVQVVVTLEYFYLVSPKETLYLWRGEAAVAHHPELMDLVVVEAMQAAEQRERPDPI